MRLKYKGGERIETRESQTRETRCGDVTNVGSVLKSGREENADADVGSASRLARKEHRRGHGLRVVLTREGHRRGPGLRVASIQEREGRVKGLPRRGGEIRVSNKTEEGR